MTRDVLSLGVNRNRNRVSKQTQAELKRLQNIGSGVEASSVREQGETQDQILGIDFEWLKTTDEQGYFALTLNGFRPGLNMQKGLLEIAYNRQSQSEGVHSHTNDQVIRSWAIESQSNLQAVFNEFPGMVKAEFQGKLFFMPFMGNSGGVKTLYSETSPTDSTIIVARTFNSGLIANVFSMAALNFGGEDYLIIFSSNGAVVLDDELTLIQGHKEWDYKTRSGSNADFIAGSAVQSSIPGRPLIMRDQSGEDVFLIPSRDLNEFGEQMLQNVSALTRAFPLGFAEIEAGNPKAYYLETIADSMPSRSSGTKLVPYRSQLTSLDAYGYSHRIYNLSLANPVSACLVPQRSVIGITDGYRVVAWNGDTESDLEIFSDDGVTPGYIRYCVAVGSRDGQIIASIMDLPLPSTTGPWGDTLGVGRIRWCLREYNWYSKGWSQISKWETLTEEGTIDWSTGIPWPVAQAVNTQVGFIAAYGLPDLPIAKFTGYIHTHAVPADYLTDLNTHTGLPATASVTWAHKYESPASINPYSQRGGSHPYADEGSMYSSGLIFPGRSRYANKYFDRVEFGGEFPDDGSRITIVIGEYGTLDDINDQGNLINLHHTFEAGLSHDQRRRDLGSDVSGSAVLFPQFKLILEEGDDPTQTQQALPITVYGHVDFFPLQERAVQQVTGRAGNA